MYEKVFEQAAESFFKPISEILALNVEAFDNLRAKNTDLVSEVVNESIEYAKGLAKPNMDLDAFVQGQQTFYEGLRSKLTDNAQYNYDLLSDMQGKVTELWSGTWDAQKGAASAVVAEAVKPKADSSPKKAAAAATKAPAAASAKKAAPKATQRAEKSAATEAERKSVKS